MNRAVRTAVKHAAVYISDPDAMVQQMVYALPLDIDLGDERQVFEQLHKCQFDHVAILELVDAVIEEARARQSREAADRRDRIGATLGLILCACALYGAAIGCMGTAYAATPDVATTWLDTGVSFLKGLASVSFFFVVLVLLYFMFTHKEKAAPEYFDSPELRGDHGIYPWSGEERL